MPKPTFSTVYFLDVSSPGLETIKLPCEMEKRGRLKGAGKTLISLPRKKSRGNMPVSFYIYKGAKQKELGLPVKLLTVCELALKINNCFLFCSDFDMVCRYTDCKRSHRWDSNHR